jgi:hypothetical protein
MPAAICPTNRADEHQVEGVVDDGVEPFADGRLLQAHPGQLSIAAIQHRLQVGQ